MIMSSVAALMLIAAPLIDSGHPGPTRFTADDYDQRYETILANARLAKAENPNKVALEGVADWRMKEYPGGWSPVIKRRMYAKELKGIEMERDAKARDDSRRALEALGKK